MKNSLKHHVFSNTHYLNFAMYILAVFEHAKVLHSDAILFGRLDLNIFLVRLKKDLLYTPLCGPHMLPLIRLSKKQKPHSDILFKRIQELSSRLKGLRYKYFDEWQLNTKAPITLELFKDDEYSSEKAIAKHSFSQTVSNFPKKLNPEQASVEKGDPWSVEQWKVVVTSGTATEQL
jgi:hypothetical protein